MRYLEVGVTLALMVATWVIMALSLQGAISGGVGPAFATYVIHAVYVMFLGVAALVRCARLWTGKGSFWGRFREYDLPIGWRRLLVMSALLACITALGAYTWYVSLPLTVPSLNSAVYQADAAPILLLSVLVNRETLTLQKLLAVAVSVTGVALALLGPSSTKDPNAHPTPVGYLFVLLSVLCYSVYQITFKKCGTPNPKQRSPDTLALLLREEGGEDEDGEVDGEVEDGEVGSGGSGGVDGGEGDVFLESEYSLWVLGLIGVVSAAFMWPIMYILCWAKVEPWPSPTHEQINQLALNSFLDGLYGSLLLLGIALSSPLVMSVGTLLVIPTQIVVGYIREGTRLSAESITGIFVLILGLAILYTDLDALETFAKRRGVNLTPCVACLKWPQWTLKCGKEGSRGDGEGVE